MKTKTFFAILPILGLLVACSPMNHYPMEAASAVRNAKTSADHNALAKRYKDAAKEMLAKVQEHKKQLEEYEYHSHHYGRQAQELQAHCRGLIRYYEQAAGANRKMAEIHRQMASESK